MKETLTDSAMVMVMTRLWKEVLATIESLLVPPVSDKLSQQKPLSRLELDIVFKWLQVSLSLYEVDASDVYSFCSTSSMLLMKKVYPVEFPWISSSLLNTMNYRT